MSSLRDFDLPKLQQRFGLRVLVETGTGPGDSLRHALAVAKWDQVHSIDIDRAMIDVAMTLDVYLWHGHSAEVLRQILHLLEGRGPILFWLDAHFPGECSGNGLDLEARMSLRLPLEEELRAIVMHRAPKDLVGDLFLMDDAWIYRDGVSDCGDWAHREEIAAGATHTFVANHLGATHFLALDRRGTGVMIATPRGAPRTALEECLSESDRLRLTWES